MRVERIGDATLYLADCREVLPTLENVDAVVTDPPYGVAFKGKNTKHTKRDAAGYASIDDTESIVIDVSAPVITECVQRFERVAVTPGSRNMFRYPDPDHVGVFFYPSGAGLGRWGFICSQPIYYYGKDPYLAAGKGHRPDSLYTTESSEENGHPCPKPIGQMTWLVNKSTLFGETVLDPFMGSGTTGVACAKLGRKFIGIEIDAKYFEIACNRIRKAYDQPDMFITKPPEPKQEAML